MKDNLLNYMEKRFSQGKYKNQPEYSRSYVTISRQCGCFGNSIAKVLIDKLAQEQNTKNLPWHIINKEVIEEAARELRVEEKQVKEIFDMHQPGVLEDFFSALNPKASISDLKIRKTIKEIIQNFARMGGHIIVGRGGVVITRDIPDGIHIRIEASEDWRIDQVANRLQISYIEARKQVQSIDKKREDFKALFKQSKEEEIKYDMTLNNERINVYEAAELIYKLMKIRNHI